MLTHNSRGYSSPGRSVARHIVCVVMKLREMDSGAQLVSPSNPVQDSSPWIGAAHIQSDSSHLNGQSLETPSQHAKKCVFMVILSPLTLPIKSAIKDILFLSVFSPFSFSFIFETGYLVVQAALKYFIYPRMTRNF